MPDQKSEAKSEAKPAVKAPAPSRELTPAGESSNPAVQHLIAELETARANGADDDVQDIVGYLADLGFSAS